MVVEHDQEMMTCSDWLIDLGPGAGDHGGYVLYNGRPEEIDKSKVPSLTIDYLLGRKKIEIPDIRRRGNGKFLTLRGASGNNLKNVNLILPLGMLVGISGVSGSGKSSLINETLMPILSNKFYRSKYRPLPYDSLEGVENIDKLIEIDQSPIGRSPRSNPATYTNVMTDIRKLFEETPDAKIRGFKANRFSFNVKGGRCEMCKGAGIQLIEMRFLPPARVTCKECNGKRYKPDTLAVKYKGKSINDVKSMSLFPLSESVPVYFIVCVINATFMSYYVDNYVNNTQTFQINDARQLPIVIPSKDSLMNYAVIFNDAYNIKLQQFKDKVSNCDADLKLKEIQEKLDLQIRKLYGL